MMDRRRFLLASLVGALAAPQIVHSQGASRRVALVFTTSPVSEMIGTEPLHPAARYFVRKLHALGWISGQNLILELRSAEGRFERLDAILKELVDLKCDVIVTASTPTARAAKRATTTVPIVMASVADPIGNGFVKSYAQPGSNMTGLTYAHEIEIEGKKLQLLKEALPTSTRVAILESTELWNARTGKSQRATADRLALTLVHAEAAPNDYTRAFATITRERPDAILVGPGAFLFANRKTIIEFAARSRIPLMGHNREFAEAGALISYEPSTKEKFERAADYVDRILRGAKPSDLPVEEPQKYELVINLKTAKALGLTIPPSLLARADQVIE